jgi:hypothetical protein
MKIEVLRNQYTANSTIGSLYVNGRWQCYTLEDTKRDGPKIPGQTCIPAGLYKLIISFSNRFKRDLPLLVAVPNFEGVRIHPGNTDANTEGCILVGKAKTVDRIYNSVDAFNNLWPQIQTAWFNKEEILISVKDYSQ